MKKQLLVIVCFLMSWGIYAQVKPSKDYSYTVSEPYKVIEGKKKYFSYEENVLAIKFNLKFFFVQKFDKNSLLEVSRIEYTNKELFPKNCQLENIIQIEEFVYIFYSSWHKSESDKERLFVRRVDFSTGKFDDNFDKQIISVNSLVSGNIVNSGFSVKTVNKFEIIKMDGISKVLIKYRKISGVYRNSKSDGAIGLSVFDFGLNKIWGDEFKMPYTGFEMDLLDYATDAESNIYALVRKHHDHKNRGEKKGESNYHLELFKYEKESKKRVINKIDLKGKFIYEIKLYINEKKEIFCAGFYNDRKSRENVSGVVVFSIGDIDNVSENNFYKIPIEVLNQYVENDTKKKNARKDKKGKTNFESLKLRNLLFHGNGGVSIVGEQYFDVTKIPFELPNSKPSHFKKETTTYHYRDILITKINASGELSWMKRIPKRQRGSKGLGGMSFSYLYTNNNHYLLYLDNVKNIDLPLNSYPSAHTDNKGGYLTSCRINDETGAVVKSSIFDTRNLNNGMRVYKYQTDRVIHTAEDEFVIEVYKKKKEDVLIKVKINENSI